jgi:hypothetical protein
MIARVLLRDRATRGYLPPCGGGMGRGVLHIASADTPLPACALCAQADLPHKGGGNNAVLPASYTS